MSDTVYYIISAILSIGVLVGIRWMSKVETSVKGNRLSAVCMLLAILVVLLKENILTDWMVWLGMLIGTGLGIVMAQKVKMITMPQMVALLNGLGGAASAIAAWLTVQSGITGAFELFTAMLALIIGALTFSGSLVAAGKLHRLLPQKPIRIAKHQQITAGTVGVLLLLVLLPLVWRDAALVLAAIAFVLSLGFGLLFALPVGGADMPITISLLNSTSGVAAAIAGMAIGDVLLVSVGGIVGASGLLLTQIMCHAMNRKLSAILFSKAAKHDHPKPVAEEVPAQEAASVEEAALETLIPVVSADETVLPAWLGDSQDIIVIPGYGMAVSQAQELLKQVHDKLEAAGKQVRFAIHPVAGRMPGHMNVLLAEVDIPYDKLFEMDDINPEMGSADLVLVIGANDVINPAANTAEDTLIYGMPVLEASKAKRLIICNFDTKPGYAGVPNPLYDPNLNILLMLGDAKDSLQRLLDTLG